MLPDNYPVTLILRLDLPNPKFLNHLEMNLEGMMSANQLDGYYFLTQNGKPVHHSEAHLEPENRLGRAISAIQSDDILIADTDPNTGIEYGELT
jgi:hypothetical protein